MQSPVAARNVALPLLSWQRLLTAFGVSGGLGLLLSLGWDDVLSVLLRSLLLGALALLAFSIFERWPRQLPGALQRWPLQVLAVALVVPLATLAIYSASTEAGAPPFWQQSSRLNGFLTLTISGVLVAPWVALIAVVRQKEALVRHQSLTFALERSELERQALDARLQLLQRQVAPHFLFNTLANVQVLIESGSPQAATLMQHLIDYLRAAVPRLREPATTFDEELALVRAYLELMLMRMPDRLDYRIEVDDALRTHSCPSLAVLTLVENAIKHGIDPAEQGGSITVEAWCGDGRCHIRVQDSGIGLGTRGQGLGTGLQTLRDRLRLGFGEDAMLQLHPRAHGGTCAELSFRVGAGR